jgi:hypothetical protein
LIYILKSQSKCNRAVITDNVFFCSEYNMDDFILSITKQDSEFIITAPSGEQIPLGASSLPSLSAWELGAWLYRHVFKGPILMRYQEQEPDRLLLYLSFELLDWPWRRLSDGTRPLALRHPIVLLPAERQHNPAPALQLEHGPLRILLTITPDTEYAALSAAVEQMIDTFEQHNAGRVVVSKVKHHLDARHLLNIFQGRRQPFHLWHHVGPCEPDFALKLADVALKVHNLNHLLDLQPGALRGFILSTQHTTPTASRASQLKVPFLLCQSTSSTSRPDRSLLRGFYDRLLTHDLAVAGTLAQLETDLAAGVGWSGLTMLAQTTELHLGLPQPVHLPPPRREQPQVSMLFLKANPRHSAQVRNGLRIEQEMKEIKAAIRENSRFFKWNEEGAVRFKDFSDYLMHYRPMLLHFSGHAYSTDYLLLEKYTSIEELRIRTHAPTTATAEPDLIPFADIVNRLSKHQKTLRCVVLNACHTEALAEALCKQIDCAIGMRGALNDGLAIRFSELFYRAIAYGYSVDWAFRNARDEITSRDQPDLAHTFQLKSRPGVDPDTIVFVQTQEGNI